MKPSGTNSIFPHLLSLLSSNFVVYFFSLQCGGFLFISKNNIYYSHKVSTSSTDIYTLFRYYVKTYGVLIQVVLQELNIHSFGLM